MAKKKVETEKKIVKDKSKEEKVERTEKKKSEKLLEEKKEAKKEENSAKQEKSQAEENTKEIKKEERKIYSIEEAIKQLRNEEKRNFVQTVDLIINLQKIDVRKQSINTFITLPNGTEKRIAAFLTKKISGMDCILKEQFDSYKTNRELKKLAKKYDMFIAHASLMKDVAAKFGRALGPSGKMPSPQLGVILKEDEATIKETIEKMKKSVRIRTKERSIKIPVGKESMSDSQLSENIDSAIKSITEVLPLKKDNIKNILLKLTMSKPYEIKK